MSVRAHLMKMLAPMLVVVAAGAQAATVSGQFFSATVPDTLLPGDKWQVTIEDSLETMTTSLVIAPREGAFQPVGVWNQAIEVRELDFFGPQVVSVDGDIPRAVTLDLEYWSFSASGQLQSPSDALFMTAYGKSTLRAQAGLLLMMTPAVGRNVLASAQLPGVGSVGLTLDEHIPAVFDEELGVIDSVIREPSAYWGLGLRTQHSLTTPYFATPSTTNPRCADLSCLNFSEALYTPGEYRLTFHLTNFSAVPEPASWLTMALGLTAVGAMVVRRRAS